MPKNTKPTKLQTNFKFWYQHFVKGEDFAKSLKPVGLVTTCQQFWAFYQHFKRPNNLPEGSYVYFFKDGITPIWEDEHNEKGGAFVLKFEKEKSNRVWENVLLSFLTADTKEIQSINGVRIKIRKDDTVEIDIWVSHLDEQKLQQQSEWVVKATQLPLDTAIEVISFEQN